MFGLFCNTNFYFAYRIWILCIFLYMGTYFKCIFDIFPSSSSSSCPVVVVLCPSVRPVVRPVVVVRPLSVRPVVRPVVRRRRPSSSVVVVVVRLNITHKSLKLLVSLNSQKRNSWSRPRWSKGYQFLRFVVDLGTSEASFP